MGETQSSADLAYTWVKERIVNGTIPTGDLLNEGTVAGELQMSRTPVREAFLRLQAEGWMRLYPKKGALVVPAAPGELEDILLARHLIESDAVRFVADDPTRLNGLVETLTSVNEQIADANQKHEWSRSSDLDGVFHEAIVAAGGNSILTKFYRSIRELQHRMPTTPVWQNRQRVDEIVAEHTHLTQLIEARDAATFRRALMDHIVATHVSETGLSRLGRYL